MIINNKDVLQSYILTTAKYDYNVYEKRIMYRIIEALQEYTKGKKLNQKYNITENIFGRLELKMPISSFLKDEKDNNYKRVKDALKSLKSKIIEYEDDNVYEPISLINYPRLNKKYEDIQFELHPLIVGAFLDFSKGYSKYELLTAMSFDSVYTMRFYELVSNQNTAINYNITTLKQMFGIADKYSLVGNFINKVVEVAKKELDKKSPFSFEYKPIKKGRKITGLTLFPIQQKEFRDKGIEQQKLQAKTSIRFDLDNNLIDYLKSNYEFLTKEIGNNRELFIQASDQMDLLLFLAEMKATALEKKNPKGYLINAIKKQLEQVK